MREDYTTKFRKKMSRAYRTTKVMLHGTDGIDYTVDRAPEESLSGEEIETQLEVLSPRNWRKYFSKKLAGRGLEIGPLNRPIPRHDKMDIDYVDRYTIDELREHYPELKNKALVEPNIIGNAEDLEGVAEDAYDFLVASHVIEHLRNPIAAIRQWARVLRPGGKIYLIVPDKRSTFDKSRERTSLGHLVLDYQRPSSERDYQHYLDYAVHVGKSRNINDAIEFADKLFAENYSIHFHVFMPSDVANLLRWFSENVMPIKIIEGPCMSPASQEFHFLVEVL